MYELTDIEVELYRHNNLFRSACESAYRNGFTKEQMLSYLVVHLLDCKSKRDNETLEAVMRNTQPSLVIGSE